MSPLATALGLSLLGSFGGLIVASGLLLFKESLRTRLVPWLISYAVGTLLGAALLALLPEALEELSPRQVFGSLLAGIVVFFILEKLVLLRHCHTNDCHVHGGAAAQLVIFGDAFHNFIDGAIIAAAVLTSVPLGVNAAIAIAAHEIPQEVGDIAILLHSGYSRRKALILNIASGAAGIAGALFGYGMVSVLPHIRPFVIAFSSASMLYIAMSDLIPDLHRGSVDKNSLRQVLLIAAGIGTVVVLGYFGAA